MKKAGRQIEDRSALSKIVLTLGIVLTIPLQIASVLDRTADPAKGPPTLLPKTFYGAKANMAAAQLEMRHDHLERASIFALRALRLEPMNQEAVRTLGLIAQRRGNQGRAEGLMEQAANLGWRDTLTQLYQINAMAETGDVKHLAENIDAIYRRKGMIESIRPLAVGLEARQDGRIALADRLVIGNSWRVPYLRKVDDLSLELLDNRTLLLDELAKRGWHPASADIAPMIREYISLGEPQKARAVWAKFSGKSGSVAVSNGDFEQAIGPAGHVPFQWLLKVNGGMTVDIEEFPESSGNHVLRISSGSSTRINVAEQTLTLLPGAYQMRFTVLDKQNSDASNLSATLWCRDDGSRIDVVNPVATSSEGRFSFPEFTLPQTCGGTEKLMLRFTGGHGFEQHVIVIDNVEIVNVSSS